MKTSNVKIMPFEAISKRPLTVEQDPINLPRMKTIKEMAALTGLSYTSLRNLCLERKIVHIRAGKKYLINNMMIELYASMAQAEMEKKEKRQREGIAAKKARGEWADYGRPRAMDLQDFAKQYQAVERGEKKPFELMRELGMTKATFYRYKGQLKKEG